MKKFFSYAFIGAATYVGYRLAQKVVDAFTNPVNKKKIKNKLKSFLDD